MTELYLSKLDLSHFRSHKAASFTLDGRPVVIFGANGAGKTNILEAISMISPGRGLRSAKADEIVRKPEALGWKVSGVLHRFDQVHEVETRAENGAKRTVFIDEKSSSQIALGRIARMVWLVPAMDRLWSEGAEGRRRFLDRITLSFEPKHAEFSMAYEKAMRERNRLLKEMVRDPTWYGALESQMAKAGAAIITNRSNAVERLQRAMLEATTSFPTAQLSIDGDMFDDYDGLSNALEASRSADFKAGRTLVGPHRADLQVIYQSKNIAAKQCSTGEQKALLLSLILANARALSEDLGAPPIILLDEVGAHLDADRRRALFNEICALRAQVWMTGAGAELFEELGDKAQQFEVSEAQGVSCVRAR